MKKILQILGIIILVLVLALIVIFVFNPLGSRDKLLGSIINSYLSSQIEGYQPLDSAASSGNENADVTDSAETSDKHPLLNEEQEKTLEGLGVNVEQLPQEVSPEMEACLVEKVGEERAVEIAGGSAPTAMEIIKAQSCLSK